MDELKIKDYTEYTSSSLESKTGLLGSIYNFEGFAEDDTISEDDRYSEAELMDMIGKLPPEAFKSGVAQQIIQTARSGKRIVINGKTNQIEFYGDDGVSGLQFYNQEDEVSAGQFQTYYDDSDPSYPVKGLNVAFGGGTQFVLRGSDDKGRIALGFNDGTDFQIGMIGKWDDGNMVETGRNVFYGKVAYPNTDITVGAGFTLDQDDLETAYIVLDGTASRTSDTTTAIEDGLETGQILILQGTDDTNTIIIKDNANTALAGDCTLGENDTLTLIYNGTVWVELCRSNN